MNNYKGYVKAYSLIGDLVFGEIVRIADRFHVIQIENNLTTGLNANLVPIDSTKFAKKIAELPTGDYLFEFDVFESIEGKRFYIIWDYTKLAVVYMSLDGLSLPDNINIFECIYVGNIKLDDQILENFVEVEQ